MKKLLMLTIAATLLYACNNSKSDHASASTTNSSNDANMNNEERKEERNKQAALASLQAINKGNSNLDSFFKDFDKDVIEYGEGSMPPIKGLDSTRAMFSIVMKAIPDWKGSDLIAVADGDYVMVYGTWTGTWKNDMMGMKATGKSFKAKDVDIFKFNDAGKIIEHRAVQSMNELERQLGMKMPQQQ